MKWNPKVVSLDINYWAGLLYSTKRTREISLAICGQPGTSKKITESEVSFIYQSKSKNLKFYRVPDRVVKEQVFDSA